MKFNKVMLVTFILLAIISFGAVSAAENITAEDNLANNDDNIMSVEDFEEISATDDISEDIVGGSEDIENDEILNAEYNQNHSKLSNQNDRDVLRENTQVIITPDYMKECDEVGIAYFMDEPVDIIMEGEFDGLDFDEGFVKLYIEEFDEDTVINIDASQAVFKNVMFWIESYSTVVLNNVNVVADNDLYQVDSLLNLVIDGDYAYLSVNNVNMTINTNKLETNAVYACSRGQSLNFTNSQFNINVKNECSSLFDFYAIYNLLLENNIFNCNVPVSTCISSITEDIDWGSMQVRNNLFNITYNDKSRNNANGDIIYISNSRDVLFENNNVTVKNTISEDKSVSINGINLFSQKDQYFLNYNNNVSIENNNFNIIGQGIVNGVTISDKHNKAISLKFNNITISSKTANGINSKDGLSDNNIIIEGNNINLTSADATGILINSASQIIANTIDLNDAIGYGIYYIGNNNDSQNIKDNLINTKADYGIYLTTSSNSNIQENTIYANNPADDGVYIGSGEGNTISDNKPDIIKQNVSIEAFVKDDYKYGDNVIFEISLNSTDATGEITIIVNGKEKSAKLENGKVNITTSDLLTGENTVDIKYNGDSYYNNASTQKTVNISKAEAPITYSVSDIKVGKNEVISLSTKMGVTGNVIVTVNNKTYNQSISKYGRINSITLSDLTAGVYDVNIFYAGDDNYLCFNKTVSFNVTEYGIPQWPNAGYDSQHTSNSPYSSELNGKIIWNATIEGTIRGNVAIDSNGNIYVASTSGVYSFDSEGNLRWSYSAWGADPYYGIAISKDVIISPRSGDALYFIDQNTGEQYGRSIWQASSIFAPIVDENSNLYITSEYQYDGSNHYNLVLIPFSIWENGGTPYIIAIGNDAPTSSPVVINNELVGVNTENGFKIVNITSYELIGTININSKVAPVVGSGEVIYGFDDSNILAFTKDNMQLWKTEVNGGAGNVLAINDNYLFTVNAEGTLYKYDITDGSQYKVYDLNSDVSSIILVDNNVIYLITDDGVMYAFDMDNNPLFIVDTGLTPIGQPAMDKNGVMYFYTEDNTVYAIGTGEKEIIGINPSVSDIYYGQDLEITLNVDEEVTGNISVKINGITYYSIIKNGNASIKVSNLTSDNYTVDVIYSGNRVFESTSKQIQFNVKKLSVGMKIDVNKTITTNETLYIEVSLLNDTTGNVSVNILGKDYSANISEGKAVILVSNLTSGNYSGIVKYSGDKKYLANQSLIEFNVTKTEIKDVDNVLNITTVSENQSPSFSINLPSDATGNLTVFINNETHTKELVNGSATIDIKDLPSGKYDAVIVYSGDDKYGNITKSTIVDVPAPANTNDNINTKNNNAKRKILSKKSTKITAKKKTFKASKKVKKYSIILKSGKKPVKKVQVTIKIGKKTFKAKTNSKGKATFKLKKLTKKAKYTAVIKFKGDKNYKAISKKVKIIIKK